MRSEGKIWAGETGVRDELHPVVCWKSSVNSQIKIIRSIRVKTPYEPNSQMQFSVAIRAPVSRMCFFTLSTAHVL